ncbi:MAG TPA: hypothetical protein VGP46_11525 [Acidimicrobiales bacterium]|jgi:hypothetical protein|nr:hypothetical protein [Acidimicrobiales bacterium]
MAPRTREEIVSDVSQGPGWWQASDLKWYPPDTHPDYQAPAEVAPPDHDEEEPPGYEAYQAAQPAPAWNPAHDEFGLAGGPAAQPVTVASSLAPPVAPPPEWLTPQPSTAGAGPDQWAAQPSTPYTSQPAAKGRNLTAVLSVFGIIVVAGVAVLLFITLTRSSPNANSVARSVVGDLNAGKFSNVCSQAAPGTESAKCTADLSQISGEHITFRLTLGSTTTSGSKAIAVVDGSECVLGQCNSNNKDFYQLENGGTFAQLYAAAVAGSGSNSAFLIPLVEIGGKWYVTGL